MSNILFVIAHPDDEAFGPYGTMAKLIHEQHTVSVVCMCDGQRPNSPHVSTSRTEAFLENCQTIGVKSYLHNVPDLSLEYSHAVHKIESYIQAISPEIVFTHNIADLNTDHRVVADAALVGCRPKPGSPVQELYFFEIPASTDWAFSKIQPSFMPNTYVDISEFIELKKEALGRYATETYSYPDARSVEAMETLSKYRGYQVGLAYAEAFQLVFSRNRKIL